MCSATSRHQSDSKEPMHKDRKSSKSGLLTTPMASLSLMHTPATPVRVQSAVIQLISMVPHIWPNTSITIRSKESNCRTIIIKPYKYGYRGAIYLATSMLSGCAATVTDNKKQWLYSLAIRFSIRD